MNWFRLSVWVGALLFCLGVYGTIVAIGLMQPEQPVAQARR